MIGDNLAYMKKRIIKYADKLKLSQYYMSPQHNTMKELLKKLQDNAAKISEAFHAGHTRPLRPSTHPSLGPRTDRVNGVDSVRV